MYTCIILIITKNEKGSWSDRTRPTNNRLELLAGRSQERNVEREGEVSTREADGRRDGDVIKRFRLPRGWIIVDGDRKSGDSTRECGGSPSSTSG